MPKMCTRATLSLIQLSERTREVSNKSLFVAIRNGTTADYDESENVFKIRFFFVFFLVTVISYLYYK